MSRQVSDVIKEYIYLAEASYANLSNLIDNPIGHAEYLVEEKINYGFYEVAKPNNPDRLLSRELLDRYEVVAYCADLSPTSELAPKPFDHPYSENSFSATLYKSKSAETEGQYVLAMKGTNETWGDLFATDLGDIVSNGAAYDQIIDMYNFWQQIKAPEGQSYKVARKKVDAVLTAEYAALLFACKVPPVALAARIALEGFLHNLKEQGRYVDGNVYEIEMIDSHEAFSADDQRHSGLGIDPGKVVVTGHSLGGHLSAAFAALFPDETEHAYMVNGAGFGGIASLIPFYTGQNAAANVQGFFRALGAKDPEIISKGMENVTNIIGDKGVDVVAQDWMIGLSQPGRTIDFFIENTSATFGHGASPMTDSALVMALFDKLTSRPPAFDANPSAPPADELDSLQEATQEEALFV